MKLSNYYFTFGTDPDFPYQNGWVRVEAESLNQAAEIFRVLYPDRDEGILNCADYYTEAQFKLTDMSRNGNHGGYCHEVIWRERNHEPKNKERR